MSWTDEMKVDLRNMIADGLIYEEIAARLKKSRGAICGMAARMGIGRGHAKSTMIPGGFTRRITPPMAARPPSPQNVAATKSILDAHEQEARERDDLVTIAENEGCSFVVDDPTARSSCMCGRPRVYNQPYCVTHYHRVYTVVDTTSRRERVNELEPCFGEEAFA